MVCLSKPSAKVVLFHELTNNMLYFFFVCVFFLCLSCSFLSFFSFLFSFLILFSIFVRQNHQYISRL